MAPARMDLPGNFCNHRCMSIRLIRTFSLLYVCVFLFSLPASFAADAPVMKAGGPRPLSEILARSQPGDWRQPDPANTLQLEFGVGRVILELCPEFAPRHVANVKALVRERYFDGLHILRCQDNYVVQWGDPNAEKPELARPVKNASRHLPAEFDAALDLNAPFAALPDGDLYAPEVGFFRGFPVARDKKSGRMWLVHTYGMVGAGRDNAADSGGGTELYVVIGHAPRHLDRNVTLLGRVLQGMELLSALPRGPAPMGFYKEAAQRLPLIRARMMDELPEADRPRLEIFRTDTPAFLELIESRRNRPEEWFLHRAGRIEIGNVAVPVRTNSPAR